MLQAEHNLVVRMKAFLNATHLRYVIDSQRRLSRHLVPSSTRFDVRLADRWNPRADTYTDVQRLFRPIGGRAGTGGFTAAEGANEVSRIRELPGDAIVEQGIDRQVFFQRVSLPRLVEGSDGLIETVRERFVPVDRMQGPSPRESGRQAHRCGALRAPRPRIVGPRSPQRWTASGASVRTWLPVPAQRGRRRRSRCPSPRRSQPRAPPGPRQ